VRNSFQLECSDLTSTFQDAIRVTEAPGGESSAKTKEFAPSSLFGGQLVAQALQASLGTVPAKHLPVSLHASFLSAGVAGRDVNIRIERVRDGRRSSNRTCVISQDGNALARVAIGFVDVECKSDRGSLRRHLPARSDRGEFRNPFQTSWNFDFLEFRKPYDYQRGDGLHPFWVRSRDPLDEEPSWPAQAFVSDLAVVTKALDQEEEASTLPVSFDQTLWFHKPSNADEWHYLDVERVARRGDTATVKSHLFDSSGDLVASSVQTVLLLNGERG